MRRTSRSVPIPGHGASPPLDWSAQPERRINSRTRLDPSVPSRHLRHLNIKSLSMHLGSSILGSFSSSTLACCAGWPSSLRWAATRYSNLRKTTSEFCRCLLIAIDYPPMSDACAHAITQLQHI
ncbi:hypothetical protein L227DRAFT_101152 [Lentinus tigrinus ALCF2SS1-6]|uniref:Uncharacterized protein n=1 Tax=Lentinus tigrinus ALCF2SS1-6 TaxID=1328759 RepID=A0A5C2S9C5_9APHY|nr:hypothetical protein L227DRAFT_101152 [Lentinus tigrinus ALCF2SS1-6]